MKTAEYLDRLLLRYSGTFNIYQPYVINEKEYPAYGYFFSHVEKYILVREANMWSTHSYEHILFIEAEKCSSELLQEAEEIISGYMEPELVRKNEPLPEKNHMYSHLNVVLVCQEAVEKELAGKIRHYHFERGYQFNMRGFSRGCIMCISLDDKKFISNRHGREKKKLFLGVFEDAAKGKPGFAQVMEERGLVPFKQGVNDQPECDDFMK